MPIACLQDVKVCQQWSLLDPASSILDYLCSKGKGPCENQHHTHCNDIINRFVPAGAKTSKSLAWHELRDDKCCQ